MYWTDDDKNITLSVRESLFEEARRRERQTGGADTTLRELRSVMPTGGRKFTRDEMNER